VWPRTEPIPIQFVAKKATIGLEYNSYRYFIATTLKETEKIVLENIKKAQLKQKTYYDKKTKEKSFKNGDLVALSVPTTSKLSVTHKGPFVVVETNMLQNTINITEVRNESKNILVSMERVKPWFASELHDN